MVFHYAASFFLTIPFVLLGGLYAWSRWKRRRDLLLLGDWRLVRELIPMNAVERRKFKDLITLIALALLIFAATGPEFGSMLTEVKHKGVDVFIAMDTSRSMLAEDVSPSRLEHAKRALGLLTQKLDGNRVGIIAFAKRAIIQCPLTIDNDAAHMFLDILDDRTVPEQGTHIGDAIRLAVKSFGKDDKAGRAIVLLTDGEDHQSDPIGAAQEAKEKGVVIFTIGIGTTKGEVIKKRDEQGNVVEFLKHNGEMVISRMDDMMLSKIAQITGGKYYRASSTDKEVDEIADTLNGFDKKEFSTKVYDRMKERYQIVGVVALLLLIFEFFLAERSGQGGRLLSKARSIRFQWKRPASRIDDSINAGTSLLSQARTKARAVKTALGIVVTLMVAAGGARADMRDHVIRGNRLLAKGDIPGARTEFESAQIDAPEAAFIPYNIATTYYLEGNFDEAKKNYEKAMTIAADPNLKSMIAYNLGHLTFSMGDRAGAIDRFKDCLKLNPKDMDAKYNIEYIRAGKTPKNPMQQKPSNDKGGGKDKQKQKQDQKSPGQDQNQPAEAQKKPGSLSKEDAERVLQMMRDQENDKLKDAKQRQAAQQNGKEKKKEDENEEDW